MYGIFMKQQARNQADNIFFLYLDKSSRCQNQYYNTKINVF